MSDSQPKDPKVNSHNDEDTLGIMIKHHHRGEFFSGAMWTWCCMDTNRSERYDRNQPFKCLVCNRRLEMVTYAFTVSGGYRVCKFCVNKRYMISAAYDDDDHFTLSPNTFHFE